MLSTRSRRRRQMMGWTPQTRNATDSQAQFLQPTFCDNRWLIRTGKSSAHGLKWSRSHLVLQSSRRSSCRQSTQLGTAFLNVHQQYPDLVEEPGFGFSARHYPPTGGAKYPLVSRWELSGFAVIFVVRLQISFLHKSCQSNRSGGPVL